MVVLTSLGTNELGDLSLLLGAEKYLLKPVPFQQLLKEIRPYLPGVDAAKLPA